MEGSGSQPKLQQFLQFYPQLGQQVINNNDNKPTVQQTEQPSINSLFSPIQKQEEQEFLNDEFADFQNTVVEAFQSINDKIKKQDMTAKNAQTSVTQIEKQVKILTDNVQQYVKNLVTNETKQKMKDLEKENSKVAQKLENLEILLLKSRVLPVELAEAYLQDDWQTIECYEVVENGKSKEKKADINLDLVDQQIDKMQYFD